MNAPKYKKYPQEKSLSSEEENSKELTKAYINKIQKMLKDPKNAKKAAKIIEQMLRRQK